MANSGTQADQAGATSAPSTREDLTGKLFLIFILVGLPVGLATTPRTFDDGDVSWHVAAGRWMLAHQRLPITDPFSFTAYGHRWVTMEWLADLIYASAYNVAGYMGLALVVGAAMIALHATIFAHVRRSVGPIGIAAAIISADVVLGHFILARPHVLVWPILALWTAILLEASKQGRPPSWWSLILPLLWTNIHASFPLAILIAGAVALDALIAARWTNWRDWALFLGATCIALMLNANGLEGILQPFHVSRLAMLPSIVEWQASTPSMTPEFYVVLLLALAGILWHGIKLPIGRTLLLLVLLGLAFSQVRHQSWLIIVAALVFPSAFRTGGSMKEPVWPFVVAAFALLIFRLTLPLVPNENPSNPRGLLAAVPRELRSQPVLNGYSFGGPLILAGIRPYIDGRADMYGDAFFADYKAMTDGDLGRFNRAVTRYDLRWTILPYDDALLIKELDASPSWRRVYSDKVGVIHVRLK
ncbi:MAG TPA: hypothetical protein VJ846_07885 [Sphingomicrobium sp.]|nr:hypothetical protein [Sphingomicrobium sp.]